MARLRVQLKTCWTVARLGIHDQPRGIFHYSLPHFETTAASAVQHSNSRSSASAVQNSISSICSASAVQNSSSSSCSASAVQHSRISSSAAAVEHGRSIRSSASAVRRQVPAGRKWLLTLTLMANLWQAQGARQGAGARHGWLVGQLKQKQKADGELHVVS